jgi:hypothetical protein
VSALLVGVAALWAPPAAGQTLASVPDAEDIVYRHARPGYATVQLYVWGAADRPGIWEVEETIGLVELLSAARVRGAAGVQPAYKQETIVRLFRQAGDGRGLVFERSLESVLASPASTPALSDGDVVTVELVQSRRFGWRDAGVVVGTVSSVALLVIRLATL